MVDALNRASRWLAPHGRLIDIHPTPERGYLEVHRPTGFVIAGDLKDEGKGVGPMARHAHADAAVATVIAQGRFVLEDRRAFTFLVHADTLAEVQEHAASKWKDARIDEATLARATALVRANPGAGLRLREEITISRLRPLRALP